MTSPFTDEGLRQIADSKCALNNILVPHSMLIALAEQLLEARRDARRYRWLRDIQCNHFSLSLNEDPAINYVTVKKFIEEFDPEWLHDIEPDELQKMKDTNTLWHLQIYPNTPIGFNVYFGATLDAAIDAAIGSEK